MKIGKHDRWYVQLYLKGIIRITKDYRVIDASTREPIEQSFSETGYRRLFMYDDLEECYKGMLSHRLIWMVHHRKYIPKGMVINHLDGNKANNAPSNLEVTTHSGNNAHAHALQLTSSRGQANSRALFTNAQVCEMRELYATKDVSVVFMAEKYDVERQTMKFILNCKNYRSVKSSYDERCKAKMLKSQRRAKQLDRLRRRVPRQLLV